MSYAPPTGEELRQLLKRWHLTGAQAGALLDVDGRTVRRWTGEERRMPFVALYTLAHRARWVAVTPEGWREELAADRDTVIHGRPGPYVWYGLDGTKNRSDVPPDPEERFIRR